MIADAAGWVQALVLGIFQGLTEFIPVSSSGHLVLVPALAGWERHGLAFDVALHLGTLLALLVYYRSDLWGMLRAIAATQPTPERTRNRHLVAMLIVGSIPVAIVGLTLEGLVEATFNDPVSTAWLLLVTAAVLVTGERLHQRRLRSRPPAADVPTPADPALDGPSSATSTTDGLRLRHALAVGAAQSFALLPGLSRSGLTISAGIAAGLSRTDATRFSFLLGLPAIGGAALVQLPELSGLGEISPIELTIGVTASAISGYVAIAGLVRFVARAGIDRFAWYVVALSIGSLLVLTS